MRILVLDGNENQAVAAVRSLAKAGHSVVVGSSHSWSKAGWSRFCGATFQYPAPQVDAERFVKAIAERAGQERGGLVLPMTEATTLPLSAHRNLVFAAGARLVLPPHSVVLRTFDKSQTTALAASLGIAVPKTIVISSDEQAESEATKLTFPVVVKPRASEEISDTGGVRTSGRPRYARNPAEFWMAYQDVSRRSPAVLVQEYVSGEGMGYFALLHNGEVRAEFGHRRIRDVHPSGSGSAVRESVELDPEVREAGLALLRALQWDGVAMVEFRRQPGKQPVFLEVNGRFWHSLALACYAEVDFPALLARMAESGDVEPISSYRTGVRCRWLLGDVRHLVEVWRGAPPGFPEAYPGRLRTLLSVLMPVPGTRHDLFNWSDPLPEAGDWLDFVRRMMRHTSQQRDLHAQGRYSHS